jgi:hypothetical protein
MGSGVGIAWVAAIGLLVAAVMRARAIANLMPLLEAAARAHQARIHQSFLGMPQITKFHSGHAMRMTLMRVSTSSPEGGGEMTCVDFDWPAPHVGEFRVRERVDARRNAVPVALMGGARPFTLGSPEVDARYLVVGTDPVASLGILGNARVVESIMALPHGACGFQKVLPVEFQ